MSINQSSGSAAETEAVKEIYAAINRNDIEATLKFFAPEIVRIEPEGFPSAGTYRGHQEIKIHLSKGRGTWAEGNCDPERLLMIDDKVIAFLHVLVRLKDKTEWIDGRLADVFTFRNGKVIEMRTFAEGEQALKWIENIIN